MGREVNVKNSIDYLNIRIKKYTNKIKEEEVAIHYIH